MVGRGGERRGAHSGEGEQLGVAGDALRPQIDRRGRRIRRLKTTVDGDAGPPGVP